MRRIASAKKFTFVTVLILSLNILSPHIQSFAALGLPSAICGEESCTISLTSTSDYYTWTVPAGVSSLQVVAIGGGGGTGYYSTERAPGGLGAKLTETVTVIAGDQLYFYVGSAGGNGGNSIAGAAGTNTAGSSGAPGATMSGFGGGGGGAASEVRRNGTATANRIIVAAGGGGGGAGCGASDAANQNNDAGGNASGNTGGAGLCTGYSSSNRGMGGTISADGNGGSFRYGRTANMSGGGGGGGYFGGGAGNQGGGGAGSSWINATYVSGSFASASTVSAGSISFTYAYTLPRISRVTVNNGTTLTYRVASSVEAIVTSDGYVTFLSNGKKVAGCVKLPTNSLSATCNFKPSIHGSIRITTILYVNRNDSTPAASFVVHTSSDARTNKR